MNKASRLLRMVYVVSLVAWAGADASMSSADDDVVRADYLRYCGSCHGLDGRGDGPAAPALRDAIPDLRTIAVRRDGVFPEASIIRMIDGRDPVIAHGSREMPVWGKQFTFQQPSGPSAETAARGEALLLTLYLKSLQIETQSAE